MRRLALSLAAIAMSASAHATVYEVVCAKSELTPKTAELTYRVLFDDVNRLLVIVTETKMIPYIVDRVIPHGRYIEAVGQTQVEGVTWGARFTDPRLTATSISQWFASFNGRKQVTDQCEDAAL